MLEIATAASRIVDHRDLLDEHEAGQLAVELDDSTPQELLSWALERWGSQLAICTSFQAEGMAILDMAWRIDPKVRLFTVDTGRLPQETYDVMETVRQRYGIEVEVYFPDAVQVESMVRRFGPNLFQKSVQARLVCCNVRKVDPIRGVLQGLDAWVTGLRRDQWASRANIRKIEIDHDHGGLAKINPLADWMLDEVKEYNEAHDVPVHPLYAKGFTSIGCTPCTRATAPGEDPRAGRWWWEKNAPKECGIHCPIETGAFEHELEAMLHPGPRRADA
ncbi:MAG TPA: phosphoadenylyl-sulfate reductase [Thermoanaerobaculia bacterium]|jgi:thioredoxin-dependent adenylylsulfate APS reductase|nr:phosphoadenylyl-sulfate reductase [Thermoanaerobaculia bacterium]